MLLTIHIFKVIHSFLFMQNIFRFNNTYIILTVCKFLFRVNNKDNGAKLMDIVPVSLLVNLPRGLTFQPVITCSRLTIETLE